MAEFMHLPHVELEEAALMHPDELRNQLLLDDFFDALPALYQNFSYYLIENGLPGIKCPV